jgi:hypothetical protein
MKNESELRKALIEHLEAALGIADGLANYLMCSTHPSSVGKRS